MKRLSILFVCCFLIFQMAGNATAKEDTSRLVDLTNGIYQDSKTDLMWQVDKSRHLFSNKEEALKYAHELRLGGFTDWRLPSLAERWDLLQVFEYKNNGECEFPKQASRYWTTETDKGTVPIKLDISCLCRGDQEVEYKSSGFVRAVRTSTP